jgi:hypothetical protein
MDCEDRVCSSDAGWHGDISTYRCSEDNEMTVADVPSTRK